MIAIAHEDKKNATKFSRDAMGGKPWRHMANVWTAAPLSRRFHFLLLLFYYYYYFLVFNFPFPFIFYRSAAVSSKFLQDQRFATKDPVIKKIINTLVTLSLSKRKKTLLFGAIYVLHSIPSFSLF